MLDLNIITALQVPEGNIAQISIGDNVIWTKPEQMVYLFKDGDQYTDITGGWRYSTSFYYDSNNSNKGTVNIGTTITCKTSTGQCAFATTQNKIDLTKYKNIIVTATDAGSKPCEIALTASTGSVKGRAVACMKISLGENILPIPTDLTEPYYICVGTAGGETVVVTSVALEKK